MLIEDYFDPADVIMKVSLLKADDPANELLATNKQMMVIRKGQKKVYPLTDIKKLTTGQKILLFPLITGGIITPFAFLSYFTYFDFPWIHLLAFFAGFWLLFLGISGRASIGINLRPGDIDDIMLPAISLQLRGFISFFNEYLDALNHPNHGFLMYFEAPAYKITKDELLPDPQKMNDIFPIKGYSLSQLHRAIGRDERNKFVAIDPFLCQGAIHFVPDESRKEMVPLLTGPAPASSIISDHWPV